MRGSSRRSVVIVLIVGLTLGGCDEQHAELQPRDAAAAALSEQDQQMFSWIREAADKMEAVMERWVTTGTITEEQLFAEKYSYIQDTDPPKFHTAYDVLSDNEITPIQEVYVSKAPEIAYLVLVDRNGYLPTHNLKYRKPLTGDRQRDLVGNRTKRKFSDPIGLAQARNTNPHILQSYTPRTGQSMKGMAVPITLFGKHWGALRVGYYPQ